MLLGFLQLQRRRADKLVLRRIGFKLPTGANPAVDGFRAAQRFRRLADRLALAVDQCQGLHDLECLQGS